MVAIQAAVFLMTAALAKVLFAIDASLSVYLIAVILLSVGMLRIGRFTWLERIMKLTVAILVLSTLLATVLTLHKIQWSNLSFSYSAFGITDLFFVTALLGLMPAGVDLAVLQSLWTLSKKKQSGEISVKNVMLDFRVGYFGTILLSLCFLFLGAGIMHGSGIQFASAPPVFASQVIRLFTSSLGDWSHPIIASCAFSVMFSTTLAIMDGFPRMLAAVFKWMGSEVTSDNEASIDRGNTYWFSFAGISLSALLLATTFVSSLKGLVTLATTLAFVIAPVLAWLNHRAILQSPAHVSRKMKVLSQIGIIVFGIFSLLFLYLKFI